MKKLFLLVALIASVQAYAQETYHTDRSTRKMSHSGYGALTSNYSRFNGEDAVFVGAYGGWLVNHKLMIGIGGQYLVTQHDGSGINTETNKRNEFKMGYGGMMVEYTFFETKAVHVTANTLVGIGLITNGSRGSYDPVSDESWNSTDESGFLTMQPSLNVEINVAKWFRVSAGGGYRLITSADIESISNRKMSAPTANVTLKFGVF